MEFEIVSGKRRNSKLLYSVSEKQLYAKRSEYKNKIFYQCYNKDCKSRVFVMENTCAKYSDFIEHNHADQEALYNELKALNEIKVKCLDIGNLGEVNALTGIRESFRSVCNSSQEATKCISFPKIQRGLQYLASNVFMTSPQTPADVQQAFQKESVFRNFGLCRHEGSEQTPFFKICHAEKDFSYCLFASDKCVKLIRENIPVNSTMKILIDGTFAVVPMGCFKQLLLINIEYYDKIFPFIFVLMDKKSSKGYIHLFKFLNSNILSLDGASFILDYEMGLRKAIKSEFPKSKLFGCWFHFCQALRRQITTKNKGLAAYIRQNKEASLYYHKLLSLPLLPPGYITASFDSIKSDIEAFDHHFKFAPFIQYYEKQWLKKIGPDDISVSATTTRTTSALEAYNGVLGKMIPKHGNFFKFVQILQNEEFSKSRDFDLLVNSGGAFGKTKRKRKSVDKSEKIAKAVEELQKGKITASAFLNRMVFPKNETCVGMEPEEDLFEDVIYLEEEAEEDEKETEAPTKDSNYEVKLCVVCVVEEPNVVFLPCRHMKTCNECVLKLQADAIANNQDKFHCPICRQPVDDTIQAFL